ncbi:hypothetical protein B0T17DRAFT_70251 [Bombardia bombarda]|uniref:2EXR domain-containing protein n=1 Tax=Bombardia bombarda TaxID=252184 RepID=A0AA40CG17_9PEZI|nr:hypothetical protein B0T17DRAFT_70251 [Bombardia bombarda]
MSSDEGGSPGPEEMYSLEQVLDRFIAEVNHVSRDGQANYRRLESQLRAQFASIRRDLSRQVGREFASLRSELSGVGNPGPSSCCSEHTKDNVGAGRFPLFHRLPPEIRARIWTMALPERVVELRATYMHRPPPLMPAQRLHPPLLPPAMSIVAAASMAGGAGTGLEFGGGNPPITLPPPPPPISNSNGPVITTNRLPPPAIAHVCHEARTIALSHGSLRRTKAIEDGSGMGMLNPWGWAAGRAASASASASSLAARHHRYRPEVFSSRACTRQRGRGSALRGTGSRFPRWGCWRGGRILVMDRWRGCRPRRRTCCCGGPGRRRSWRGSWRGLCWGSVLP